MRYITFVLAFIVSTKLKAQNCPSVMEQLVQIANLKVAYEKTLDTDMTHYHKTENKNYDPDISRAKAMYTGAIEKVKADNFSKTCLEMMIAKNDTAFSTSFIHYRYINPLLSSIPDGTVITRTDYLKAVHYSVYVINSDTLLHTRRIPELHHLFKNHSRYKH